MRPCSRARTVRGRAPPNAWWRRSWVETSQAFSFSALLLDALVPDGPAGGRGVRGVSARCWVLREQARPSSPLGGWGAGGVFSGCGWGAGRASARVFAGVWRGGSVSWWPWGVCELDSGCEHLISEPF